MNKLLVLLIGALCVSGLLACTPQAVTPDVHSKPDFDQSALWNSYRARAEAARKLDQDFIAAELRALGQNKSALPAYTKEFGFNVNQPDEWFDSKEGRRIMDIIVSFQTPSGGWSKRTDMATEARAPGVAFGVEKKYIPTFDNSATSTQLELLAKAYTLTGKQSYADAFYKGLALIIEAQYPNGGWPQSYPLAGGYHDHITYNDALMKNLMGLLHKVSLGRNEFAFVTADARRSAAVSLDRGLDCVLNTQVKVNGVPTIWGAQHEVSTLAPAQARAYEMPSLATLESAAMLDFLMDLDAPSAELVNAIHAAVDWYEQNKIAGYAWQRGQGALVADPAAPPLWSRFVELNTNLPIFGDRDGSIHYDVRNISPERRDGYAWFTTAPNKVLKKYSQWAEKFPRNTHPLA